MVPPDDEAIGRTGCANIMNQNPPQRSAPGKKTPFLLLESFEKFLSVGAEAAGTNAVPDDDKGDGNGEDQC